MPVFKNSNHALDYALGLTDQEREHILAHAHQLVTVAKDLPASPLRTHAVIKAKLSLLCIEEYDRLKMGAL